MERSYVYSRDAIPGTDEDDMKAILEFSLPEDRVEYEMHNQAEGMRSVLWELEQSLRRDLKYGHEYDTANEALEAVRDTLHELMNQNKVNLED